MIDLIEQMIDDINEQMINLGVTGGTRYAYYQGKIDGMREIAAQLEEARV
jgi:hypothetical protein